MARTFSSIHKDRAVLPCYPLQSSKHRPDVTDLLLHPFITAALPAKLASKTTAAETYLPALPQVRAPTKIAIQ